MNSTLFRVGDSVTLRNGYARCRDEKGVSTSVNVVCPQICEIFLTTSAAKEDAERHPQLIGIRLPKQQGSREVLVSGEDLNLITRVFRQGDLVQPLHDGLFSESGKLLMEKDGPFQVVSVDKSVSPHIAKLLCQKRTGKIGLPEYLLVSTNHLKRVS